MVVLGLALPASLGLLSLPGRAQAPGSPRFAFADTTLLRDTLGLRFDRLFETADSLRLLPDSLRAQIIRYRLPMRRLLVMADSMGVPVDSVGVMIARERFNPFSAGSGGGQSTFRYTSSYDIGRINTHWSNGGDYSLQRGAMTLRNTTTIDMDRNNSTAGLSLQQRRSSRSDASWKVTPGISVGGVASLTGFDQSDPGSITNQRERINEFQFSSNARSSMSSKASSADVRLLAGYLDVNNRSQLKRGLSGDVSGHSRFIRGEWLSHDFTAGANGNLSRTGRPGSPVTLGTHDLSSSVRGALLLAQSTPVGLNVNYSARRSSVETPTDADTVSRLVTSGATADATLQLRLDSGRYLHIAGNLGTSTTLQGVRTDQGSKADGRWTRGPWALDADISDAVRVSRLPRRNLSGGYNERQDDRQSNATLQRPFGQKIVTKLTTRIALSQYRTTVVADSAVPPTPRDSYQQSYRIEGLYNASEKVSSGVALEVGLSRSINLPSTSTANNNDTRTYRAEWRWNYRLLKGLTASQINSVQAAYQFFPFASDRNELSLDYNSSTTLNAVLTPRLTVEVSHNARQQPGGEWRAQPDGSFALLRSDENLNYTLRSRVTWTLSPSFSITLSPEYLASDRLGTANGVEAPTTRSRRLNFSGGANLLNLPLGPHGQLSGTILRTFNADRRTTFSNGLPQASPLSQQDFWQGTLQLTWDLTP